MANRDEGMGVMVAGSEREGVMVDRLLLGEGESEVSFGARHAPPTTQERNSRGTNKETKTRNPCRHRHVQCMFHLSFIHTMLVVLLAYSSNLFRRCSGGVPVKTVFERNYFSHENMENHKFESTSGVPLGEQTTYFHNMYGCAWLGGK